MRIVHPSEHILVYFSARVSETIQGVSGSTLSGQRFSYPLVEETVVLEALLRLALFGQLIAQLESGC